MNAPLFELGLIVAIRNASDPNQHADVCAEPLAAEVAKDDPNHSISGVNMQCKSFLGSLPWLMLMRRSIQHLAPG